MSEKQFPESEEAPEARSARAVEALELEEQRGLGFRRRDRGQHPGDPWANPEAAQVGKDESPVALFAGFLASVSVIMGLFAFANKPLLWAPIGVPFAILGLLSDRSAKIARLGFFLIGAGFVVGMIIAITYDNPVF